MEAMPSSRWDAVIFDYGRVLSLAPSEAELQEFAALVGVTEPPFFEIYSATRLDYDAGRADFRQHWLFSPIFLTICWPRCANSVGSTNSK
jgi:hypothetical protein